MENLSVSGWGQGKRRGIEMSPMRENGEGGSTFAPVIYFDPQSMGCTRRAHAKLPRRAELLWPFLHLHMLTSQTQLIIPHAEIV